VIRTQLVKSGTSIGANVEEADGAVTKRDFTNKITIARKEAKETKYWLKLIAGENIKPELLEDDILIKRKENENEQIGSWDFGFVW